MYRTESLFSYADNCYAVFPPVPFDERKQPTEGSCVFTDNYTIFFEEGTSDEIKNRLVKDYAEFYQNELQEGRL